MEAYSDIRTCNFFGMVLKTKQTIPAKEREEDEESKDIHEEINFFSSRWQLLS